MKTSFQATGVMLVMTLFAVTLPIYCLWMVETWHDRELYEELQLKVESLQDELDGTVELMDTLRQENEKLTRENEILVEENLVLRSETVFRSGSRESNKVAITMDDGNIGELVELTLDYLQQHDVRATFFPMGSWVERAPDLWRRAVEEGHELGNHTYSHRLLTRLTKEQIHEEFAMWQETVDEAVGFPYRTLYFRPPGMAGFTGGNSAYYQEIIAENGMVTVLWDIEIYSALMGQSVTPVSIADYIVSEAQGGSIILLHFERIEIEALPHIIRGLRDKGLEPVTLTEMFLSAAL